MATAFWRRTVAAGLLWAGAAEGQTYRDAFGQVNAHKYGFEMGLLGLAFHPGFQEPDGMEKGTATPLADIPAKPSSWATDSQNRLYVLGHDNGRVYLLDGADWGGGPVGARRAEGRPARGALQGRALWEWSLDGRRLASPLQSP